MVDSTLKDKDKTRTWNRVSWAISHLWSQIHNLAVHITDISARYLCLHAHSGLTAPSRANCIHHCGLHYTELLQSVTSCAHADKGRSSDGVWVISEPWLPVPDFRETRIAERLGKSLAANMTNWNNASKTSVFSVCILVQKHFSKRILLLCFWIQKIITESAVQYLNRAALFLSVIKASPSNQHFSSSTVLSHSAKIIHLFPLHKECSD